MGRECTCSPYELLHQPSQSCAYHSKFEAKERSCAAFFEGDSNIDLMEDQVTIFPPYSEIKIFQQSSVNSVRFILSPFEKLLYAPTTEEQNEINRRLRDGEELMDILDDMSGNETSKA